MCSNVQVHIDIPHQQITTAVQGSIYQQVDSTIFVNILVHEVSAWGGEGHLLWWAIWGDSAFLCWEGPFMLPVWKNNYVCWHFRGSTKRMDWGKSFWYFKGVLKSSFWQRSLSIPVAPVISYLMHTVKLPLFWLCFIGLLIREVHKRSTIYLLEAHKRVTISTLGWHIKG